MTGAFDVDDAATPLAPEEREGLKPTHVTSHRELNELEEQNILKAVGWAFTRKRNALSEPFLRRLHKRMLGDVWRWAGSYRKTEKNLGIAVHLIETELHQSLRDAKYWIDHNTYPPDEIAIRLHHRLVSIHPFPNGNGRWSRLAADLLIVRLGGERFTWGMVNLQAAGDLRDAYIEALHKADNYDIGPLLLFARS